MVSRCLVLLASLFIWLGSAHAADPMITRIVPKVASYPQYFALAQGTDRSFYIGGTSAILRFDGSHWQQFTPSQPGAVRVLINTSDGRMWFGGSNCFGYLDEKPDGSIEVVELTEQFSDVLKESFSDVWGAAEHQGILFLRSLHHLFAFDVATAKRVGFWHNPNRLGGPFVVNDVLYLQWRGEGLRQWNGKDFAPIANTEAVSRIVINNMFPLSDGGVLIHDLSPAFYRLNHNVLTRIEPKDQGLLSHLNSGVMVGNDQFVFAGDNGHLIAFDAALGEFHSVRVGSTFVAEVIRDQDGGLVALDSQGLSKMDWPPRLIRYSANDNMVGSVRGFALLDGQLLLMSSAGLYAASLDSQWRAGPLKSLDWTTREAWAYLPMDGDGLFAESMELRLIKNQGVATTVSNDDLYPRYLVRDPRDPSKVWIGTEHGPALLHYDHENSKLIGRVHELGWQINSLVVNEHGAWFGSANQGLALAKLDPSAPEGFRVERDVFKDSIRYQSSRLAKVSRLNGALTLSTDADLFQFNGKTFVPHPDNDLRQLQSAEETLSFVEDEKGADWAFSFKNAYFRPENGTWIRLFTSDSQLGSLDDLIALPDGVAYVGGSLEMIRMVGVSSSTPATKPNVRISSARLIEGDRVLKQLRLDQVPRFRPEGALEVTFAYSHFDTDYGKEFQFRLAGLSEEWSAWNSRPDATFYSLPQGAYELNVRARLGASEFVESTPFRFEVQPYWYQRPWIRYLLLVLATAAIGAALVQRQRLRVRRLRALNAQLDQLVLQRTSELENANQRLQNLADSDGLTGIANRRRFDQFLAQSHALAKETNTPLGLAILDVDHFKSFNDNHGHQAGDQLLKKLAEHMSQLLRSNTLVARYGGEEFAIVAPNCDFTSIHELAERIRAHIDRAALGATVSIGVTALDPSASVSIDALIQRADQALYLAKSKGRNQVQPDTKPSH